jgi:hypothetical protein
MLKIVKCFFLFLVATISASMSFAEATKIDNYVPNAEIVGNGEYKFLFMKVFSATTYAPQGKLKFDQPFALELKYERNIKGEAIVNKTIEEISHQSNKVDQAELKTWQNELIKIIPNVTKGSILTGIYTSDQQTLFFDKNWSLLGKVDGAEFAKHFFGIWLGPDSSDSKLKNKLLGLSQ